MRGHIRERSPGHWAIVIEARDQQTGGRKRRWHSFTGSKRAAELECARLVSELQGGATVDPNKITVTEFLEQFDRDWITANVSAGTAERYRGALQHVRRCLGDRLLQKLRPVDLAGFYAGLLRDGMAPRTIKLTHRILHRALGQAAAWGLTRDNVAEQTKPPRVPEQETKMIQPDQAAKLLERLHGGPLYLLASLALATGMRRNELLALRWQDVNLDKAQLTVEQALEQTGAFGVRVKSPKTKRSRRTISLPAPTVAELRSHWVAQQQQRLAVGLGKAPDSSPVLATATGEYWSPDAVSHQWRRAVPGITLHSLRHVHASVLIASGMDILTISRRLGHASATVTLNVYGHLIHGSDDRAAQVLAAVFGSKMVADATGKPGNTR
jgi:integrase